MYMYIYIYIYTYTYTYSRGLADAIHSAIQEEALSQRATAAMASVPKVRGKCDDAEDEMIGRQDPTGHREKLGPEWRTVSRVDGKPRIERCTACSSSDSPGPDTSWIL